MKPAPPPPPSLTPRRVLARLRRAHGGQEGWWPVDAAWHAAHGTDPRFEVCLGAILTQNTNWNNVERALANLKADVLLDAPRIARVSEDRLRRLLRPAGSYNQKTRYVQAFARCVAALPRGLDDLFDAPLETLRARLLALPGIGPETADDILVYAAGQPSFVVDAYTRRLTLRLGLGTGHESYAHLQTLWSRGLRRHARAFAQAHALIVNHAKAFCRARSPSCEACPLSSACPRLGIAPPDGARSPRVPKTYPSRAPPGATGWRRRNESSTSKATRAPPNTSPVR